MFEILEAVLPTGLVRRILPVRIENLPETVLIQKYIEAGKSIGVDLFDVVAAGEPIGFEEKFNLWAKLEREYARRGYKTIGTFMFISALGSDAACDLFTDKCVGKKRNAGEKPVFHAEIYRNNFLGRDPLDYDGQPYTEKAILAII